MTTNSRLEIAALLALGLASLTQLADRAAASTVLGAARSFAVLGATTVTNTGPTAIIGDLGVYPGASITGTGTISLAGTTHAGDAPAQQVAASAAAAYSILASLPATHDLTGQNLGGLTLLPGVYRYTASAQLTGSLTLNFAVDHCAGAGCVDGGLAVAISSISDIPVGASTGCLHRPSVLFRCRRRWRSSAAALQASQASVLFADVSPPP